MTAESTVSKERAVQRRYEKFIKANIRVESSIANEKQEDSIELSTCKDTVFNPDYRSQIIHHCTCMQI